MTTIEITSAEWQRLRELRENFLDIEGRVFLGDYWRSRRDLELYDETFGRRIAWKWDAVLVELAQRGRLPGALSVLDWGCGTGVASRGFAARVPGVRRVQLWDRSQAASGVARGLLLAEHPEIEVDVAEPDDKSSPDVLCVSHVLDELSDEDLASLVALARRSRAVIWVEPGTPRSSRRLVEMRETLHASFDVLAPCTHQAACGLRADVRNWCHHFTAPPPEVFTTAFWRRFAVELSIDLRSLPYSFIALAAREAREPDGCVARILGRPRITKGRALLDVCDESGVRALPLLERLDKQLFKRLDRNTHEPLLAQLEVGEKGITAIREREHTA